MKIETGEQYDEALLFLDAFFEDPDSYSKEDAQKVKEMLVAVTEYENAQKKHQPNED